MILKQPRLVVFVEGGHRLDPKTTSLQHLQEMIKIMKLEKLFKKLEGRCKERDVEKTASMQS